MKYIKEWSNYNPVLNKKVKDFVELNKFNLPELWDNSLSEQENIDFMLSYFSEYPEEMNSELNVNKIKKARRTKSNSLRGYVPILQNIGGVDNFRYY